MFQTMWKGVKFTLGVVLGMGIAVLPLVMWLCGRWSVLNNVNADTIEYIQHLDFCFAVLLCLCALLGLQAICWIRRFRHTLSVSIGLAIASTGMTVAGVPLLLAKLCYSDSPKPLLPYMELWLVAGAALLWLWYAATLLRILKSKTA